MQFIKKQKLIETGVNPLNVTIKEDDPNKLFVQSILNAIASETEAGVEYGQILSALDNLTDTNLKNLFKNTLEDIRKEEIKHLAQLNTQLSKVDMVSDAYADGVEEANSGEDKDDEENTEKEDVKESGLQRKVLTESTTLEEALNLKRMYTRDAIEQVMTSILDITDDQYDHIVYDIIDANNNEEMVTGEEAYEIINTIIDYLGAQNEKEEILRAAEENLNATTDPELEKLTNDIDDLSYDIESITECLSKLYSQTSKNAINSILEELQSEKSRLTVDLEMSTAEHA